MSYDDGQIEDRRLVSILNRYGLKGTFHLNSGLAQNHAEDTRRIPPEEWTELYRGHEVACHTVTHPTISRCPIEHTAMEVLKDREYLEEIMGYPVRGMSYPNGSYSDEIISLLPSLGVEYSRMMETTGGFSIPEGFYRWKGTCHHNQELLKRTEEFLSLNKSKYLYMMYVWGHSYEFAQDNNWELLETFGQMIGQREDIWYATNIEIVDYLKCAKMLRVTVSGDKVYNLSAKEIWLNIDGEIMSVKSGETLLLR